MASTKSNRNQVTTILIDDQFNKWKDSLFESKTLEESEEIFNKQMRANREIFKTKQRALSRNYALCKKSKTQGPKKVNFEKSMKEIQKTFEESKEIKYHVPQRQEIEILSKQQ